jgi:hypothetical protein
MTRPHPIDSDLIVLVLDMNMKFFFSLASQVVSSMQQGLQVADLDSSELLRGQ